MYRIREHVDMAQKGIPEKYRVEIWMVYSGNSIQIGLHKYPASITYLDTPLLSRYVCVL